MAKRKSPTQRTMEHLRRRGQLVGIVERYSPFPKPFGKRHDLFNFIDLVMLDHETKQIVGIQCSSHTWGDPKRHLEKIVSECNLAARRWLKCGGRIEIWYWKKYKRKRGGTAIKYEPNVITVTKEMLRGRTDVVVRQAKGVRGGVVGK